MPTKQYYQEHKDRYKNNSKKYYQEHKEETSEYNKEYYQSHKEIWEQFHKDRNPKRILFKDKRITLDENPRTGICSRCQRSDIITNLHHIQYHDDDPLKDTVELCVKCHAEVHNFGGKT